MSNTVMYQPGSIISAAHSTDGGCSLALVVDQKRVLKWLRDDPFLAYQPDNDSSVFVCVRWLGLKLAEMNLAKSGLPAKEPSEAQTERWGYVQLNQSFLVAGPDVASIEQFMQHCQITSRLLNNVHVPFWRDLSLVFDHLSGLTRQPTAISHRDKKYFAMLADVLPRAK